MQRDFYIKIKENNKYRLKFFNSLNDIKKYKISHHSLGFKLYYKNIYILETNKNMNNLLFNKKNVRKLKFIKEGSCSIFFNGSDIDEFTYKLLKVKEQYKTYLLIINEYEEHPNFVIINNYTLKNILQKIEDIIFEYSL